MCEKEEEGGYKQTCPNRLCAPNINIETEDGRRVCVEVSWIRGRKVY